VLDRHRQAGGFREFAKTTKVFILRANPDGSTLGLRSTTKKRFAEQRSIKIRN